MKTNFKKEKNQNRGITLIALVITIIILLILAGVVIATLTGDNGILTNANKASKKQIESTVTENMNLAVQTANMEAQEKSTQGNYLAQNNMKSTAETIGQELNGNKDLISTNNKYQIVYDSSTITVTYGKAIANDTNNNSEKISGGNSDYAKACNYDNAVIKATINVTGNTIEIECITGSERKTGTETPGTVVLYGEETIGSVYTDEMIGQEISYTANTSSGYTGKWIIFGKDSSGNVLITTEKPIDEKFELYGSAEKWLTYENDLHTACSGYGGTVQGQNVTSRSITMADINYVSGCQKPEGETYTFGSVLDYDNKKVNWKYPSTGASATSYWQDPAVVPTTFKDDSYGYYYYEGDDEQEEGYYYLGPDTDWDDIDVTERNIKKENLKYIWGGDTEETCYNDYLVASRSVGVRSGYVYFRVAGVYGSVVYTNYSFLCFSNADGVYDRGTLGAVGVRPVVSLPSNIQVEKQKNGTYDLKK